MPYINPLKREDLNHLEEAFKKTEGFLGFLPNDVLTMAYYPEATANFMTFCTELYAKASLPAPLLGFIGMMTSSASGCRYCTAHNANLLYDLNVDPDKVAAAWDYENSELFSDSERAALSLAVAAGQTPSQVTPQTYERLRKHYTEKEIVEMLFVICQFGFWNRWNDSVGTLLEDIPKKTSIAGLPAEHWTLGKHS